MQNNCTNQKLNAYTFLKNKLLNCEILPGSYINEKELIQSSEFGRTPIREALIMLQLEGFVEVKPRKGTYAKPIIRQEVLELFALRKLLEPSVVIEYRVNIDMQGIMTLDNQMKTLCTSDPLNYDKNKFYTLDINFHRLLVSSCKNSKIINTMEPLLLETYRMGLFNNLANTENRPMDTYEQHHKILEAILSDNEQSIREAYMAHLNRALISSLSAIKE